MQAYHLQVSSGLVRLLKNGTRKVTKKSLKRENPLSKEFLYQFSKEHPEIFEQYKRTVSSERNSEASADLTGGAAPNDLIALLVELRALEAGSSNANAYHNLMIGIVEALFYPSLIYPKKEQILHGGRKRIDITYSNAANKGFFHWLHSVQHVPCSFVMVECKNYSADPANPELDQLAGRFSVQRGQFGLLVCRTCEDRDLFEQRCRDTARDGRGHILLLTDSDIETLVEFRRNGDQRSIDSWLDSQFRKLIF